MRIGRGEEERGRDRGRGFWEGEGEGKSGREDEGERQREKEGDSLRFLLLLCLLVRRVQHAVVLSCHIAARQQQFCYGNGCNIYCVPIVLCFHSILLL